MAIGPQDSTSSIESGRRISMFGQMAPAVIIFLVYLSGNTIVEEDGGRSIPLELTSSGHSWTWRFNFLSLLLNNLNCRKALFHQIRKRKKYVVCELKSRCDFSGKCLLLSDHCKDVLFRHHMFRKIHFLRILQHRWMT